MLQYFNWKNFVKFFLVTFLYLYHLVLQYCTLKWEIHFWQRLNVLTKECGHFYFKILAKGHYKNALFAYCLTYPLCRVSWKNLFYLLKILLTGRWSFSVCLSIPPPPQSQSISLPPPPSLSDLWNSCWEGPILSTMYHEVMLQLGLFKKWLMYFINYLFTYARPVSMTMLFLLMPYCCTLFQYPAMNILTSLGLNKPVGWKVWQYVTP